MLKCKAAVVIACLVWVGHLDGQTRQLSDLLALPEEELERLIYRRAMEIRTATMSRPVFGSLIRVPDLPGVLSAGTIEAAPLPLEVQAALSAESFRIPKHLAFGLIKVESNWNPRAVSSKGAVGLTQVLPSTADSMGFTCDLHEPSCNLRAGFTYLRAMLDTFRDPRLALAAYNAGPGVFSKSYAKETRTAIEAYVRAVIRVANETN